MTLSVAPLQPFTLRQIWKDEALDFTPWLARPENLAELGRALGLGRLEFEAREQPIGDFSLDILARDPFGHRVVIENQLEPSDHRHLGQLLTYTAGTTDGLTIIWVASMIRVEHAEALRWLNAMTPSHVGFFGVEITAWTIAGALSPGYQFRIVVRPDQLRRGDGRSNGPRPLSDEQQEYQAYWAALQEALKVRSADHWIRLSLPRSTWYGRNVGRPGFNFYAVMRPKERVLAVTLEVATAKHDADFASLSEDRESINSELGHEPQWSSTGARDYVTTELHDVDFGDRGRWPQQHAWLIDQLERYRAAFTSRIVALPIASDPIDDSAT